MGDQRRRAGNERKMWAGAVRRSGPATLGWALAVLLVVPAQAQAPSFRSASSDLVVLPVVVTDKGGRYVSDLHGEQFVVHDNGRRVPIDLFTSQDSPVTVGLIIDASGSMRPKIGELIAAALTFARSSNPDDELFAIRFNDNLEQLVPDRPFLMPTDLAALESALKSVRTDGRTALYDGIMAGLDHLATGTRARKVLVVFSDGGDNASEATLDRVLARARASNAAIYTIGIYDADDEDKNPGVLKDLAHATGAERYLPRTPGDLVRACDRIARDIRRGYTIGYEPPVRDGVYHRVKVEIDPQPARRLSVRTRPGYFAPARPAQP